MDIMELGALGELVGGLAVIASLVYVGLQVRQNTHATRAASHHGIGDSFNEINLSIMRDPNLIRILREGNEDRSALTEDERGQFDWMHFAVLRVFETVHYQGHLGIAEPQLRMEPALASFIRADGARSWWRENRYPYSSEFTRYVEALLAAPTEATGH